MFVQSIYRTLTSTLQMSEQGKFVFSQVTELTINGLKIDVFDNDIIAICTANTIVISVFKEDFIHSSISLYLSKLFIIKSKNECNKNYDVTIQGDGLKLKTSDSRDIIAFIVSNQKSVKDNNMPLRENQVPKINYCHAQNPEPVSSPYNGPLHKSSIANSVTRVPVFSRSHHTNNNDLLASVDSLRCVRQSVTNHSLSPQHVKELEYSKRKFYTPSPVVRSFNDEINYVLKTRSDSSASISVLSENVQLSSCEMLAKRRDATSSGGGTRLFDNRGQDRGGASELLSGSSNCFVLNNNNIFTGIHNFNNMCYVNSIMQVIILYMFFGCIVLCLM
jgi:hypothetical protein